MPDNHEILLPLATSAGDEPPTHLTVRAYYMKGGPDYFNGGTTARGYYVSAGPIRETADGMRMTVLGRGFSALVETATRLNGKRLDAIAAEAHRQARERTGKAWELAVAALREGKLTLADPLTETAHAAVAEAGGAS